MAELIQLKKIKDLKVVSSSTTNGNIKLDGIETTVYNHPSTHSADIIVDGTTNKAYTSVEKTKLSTIASNSTKVEDSLTNGNIKINDIENTVYTHPSGTNPHGTTKTDVGLGSCDNTTDLLKPISTATQTALNLKVDKITGKSLISDTEITRLSGIATGGTKVETSTTNGNIKINGVESNVYAQRPPNVNLMNETTHRIVVTKENMNDLIMLDIYYDTVDSKYKISDIYIDQTVGDYDIGFTYKADTSLMSVYGNHFSSVTNKNVGIYKWSSYSQDYNFKGVGGIPTQYLLFDIVRPLSGSDIYRVYTTGSTEGLMKITESSTNGNIKIDNAELEVYRNPFTQVGINIDTQISDDYTYYHMEGKSIHIASNRVIVNSRTSNYVDWITSTCTVPELSTKIANDNDMYMIFINNPSGGAFDTTLKNKLIEVGASKFRMYDTINKYVLLCYKGETMEYINFDIDTNFGFARSVIFSNYLEDRLMDSNSDKLVVDSITNTLKPHLADTVSHITSNERTNWNDNVPYITGTATIILGVGEITKSTNISHNMGYIPKTKCYHEGLTSGTTWLSELPHISYVKPTASYLGIGNMVRSWVSSTSLEIVVVRSDDSASVSETFKIRYRIYKEAL